MNKVREGERIFFTGSKGLGDRSGSPSPPTRELPIATRLVLLKNQPLFQDTRGQTPFCPSMRTHSPFVCPHFSKVSVPIFIIFIGIKLLSPAAAREFVR